MTTKDGYPACAFPRPTPPHPIDPANGRFLCSPEHPMPKGAPGRWAHTNATEIDGSQEDGWPSGDTVRMRCSDCGTTWRMELPQ